MGYLIGKIGTISNNKQDLSLYTISAEQGKLPGLISASGELLSERLVNVSPKRQGLLAEIYVDEGDRVNKGEIIARMDNGDLDYQLQELKNNFKTQKASFARRKLLFQQGAISEEEYEEFKNLYITSKSRFRQKEVEKDELNIRAPFKGLITNRFAVPGAFVTPTTASSSSSGGSARSSIVELSQGLEVIAKVPESDIGRIKTSQDATVRVDAFPDQWFEAKVTKISPRAIKSNNVTSFEVTLLLINMPEKLRIGMTADIEFRTGATAISTLVPTVAIVTEKGEPGLLIVGKNNQPKFKKVELGISSGSKTAILSGIEAGEKIFIDLPPWSKQKRD
tara:strand:+ start:1 stop:1008 length:1008 start_codon:yes stop_codon:yes gene_type:complete